MNIEIKRWTDGKIILCGEYESIKDCLEKNRSADLHYANLRSADLSYANLRYANLHSTDLRYADLRYADLRYADLHYANLCSADLRSADFRYANLCYADLPKRYIQVACIGSRKGMTTYCFEDDIVWCGCWQGNLKDFENQVKETHKENKQFLAEYLGFIKYVKGLKKI